ncbi:MAG: RNA-binding protein [Candidatus Iainarchaeum archaeon]|uniref:RNA-binding protein n=1 Tax=Candidatus Iainarchaeum sp. TaxID=3101447 RepID=A0A497JIC3_9ARCH|nr:MAG: RNA-binding protein [Candidatus Diapherotrites archaeon]
MRVCTSCNKEVITDYVKFKCPNCGKGVIIRCLTCRDSARLYKCPECGFEGP